MRFMTLCETEIDALSSSPQAAALKSHIDDQTALYGDVYLINLVNQKGYEKPVKEAFEHAMRRLGDKRAHYEYFDFHAECKGMRFDRVQGLIDRLKEPLRDQGCVSGFLFFPFLFVFLLHTLLTRRFASLSSVSQVFPAVCQTGSRASSQTSESHRPYKLSVPLFYVSFMFNTNTSTHRLVFG